MFQLIGVIFIITGSLIYILYKLVVVYTSIAEGIIKQLPDTMLKCEDMAIEDATRAKAEAEKVKRIEHE